MDALPLLFGVRNVVHGNGFVAEVVANGRALVREGQDGSWSVSGLNPGGLIGLGCDFSDAYSDFRRTHRMFLIDVAEQASTFDDFKAEVRRYFHETDRSLEDEWTAAVRVVRRSKAADLPLPKRKESEAKRAIYVRLKQLTPALNLLEDSAVEDQLLAA